MKFILRKDMKYPEKRKPDRSEIPDRIFRFVLKVTAVIIILLLAALFVTLLIASKESIREFGLGFFIDRVWDPVTGQYGALPFVVGTLVTSLLALIISLPFSLSIAVFLGEYKKSGKFAGFMKSVIELLAGIPSIIFGFWGLFYLVPMIRNLEMKLGVLPYGVGIFSASIVLAIMIIPYSAMISREVISMVPSEVKEGAYALGATRYEVIRRVTVPYVWSGIMAGIFLSLGRALGETMAVTMLIGNSNNIPDSIFSPANTMASVIANEFAEASDDLHLSALIYVGLILFLMTAVINFIGKQIVKRFRFNS
ncbi:phosphate ABC transporter permease subunit PstC [candidate division KSB1 bacterium]